MMTRNVISMLLPVNVMLTLPGCIITVKLAVDGVTLLQVFPSACPITMVN